MTFFEFLRIVLINMVKTLTMSATMATLGLLEIKLLWNKVYDVIIAVYDITKKVFLHDFNYIVIVVKVW